MMVAKETKILKEARMIVDVRTDLLSAKKRLFRKASASSVLFVELLCARGSTKVADIIGVSII